MYKIVYMYIQGISWFHHQSLHLLTACMQKTLLGISTTTIWLVRMQLIQLLDMSTVQTICFNFTPRTSVMFSAYKNNIIIRKFIYLFHTKLTTCTPKSFNLGQSYNDIDFVIAKSIVLTESCAVRSIYLSCEIIVAVGVQSSDVRAVWRSGRWN